jgi:hypothetical protein
VSFSDLKRWCSTTEISFYHSVSAHSSYASHIPIHLEIPCVFVLLTSTSMQVAFTFNNSLKVKQAVGFYSICIYLALSDHISLHHQVRKENMQLKPPAMSIPKLEVDPHWVANVLIPYLRHAFSHVLDCNTDITHYMNNAIEFCQSKPACIASLISTHLPLTRE